jgi:hypothetical protein
MDDTMVKWIELMKQYEDMHPYTDEWWDAMTNSLIFLPEDQRAGFMFGLTMAGAAL